MNNSMKNPISFMLKGMLKKDQTCPITGLTNKKKISQYQSITLCY